MTNYYSKYLKYKAKYLGLLGGTNPNHTNPLVLPNSVDLNQCGLNDKFIKQINHIGNGSFGIAYKLVIYNTPQIKVLKRFYKTPDQDSFFIPKLRDIVEITNKYDFFTKIDCIFREYSPASLNYLNIYTSSSIPNVNPFSIEGKGNELAYFLIMNFYDTDSFAIATTNVGSYNSACVLIQLLCIFDYMWTRYKFIHGDVRLDNIFIVETQLEYVTIGSYKIKTGGYRVILSDFDLSRIFKYHDKFKENDESTDLKQFVDECKKTDDILYRRLGVLFDLDKHINIGEHIEFRDMVSNVSSYEQYLNQNLEKYDYDPHKIIENFRTEHPDILGIN